MSPLGHLLQDQDDQADGGQVCGAVANDAGVDGFAHFYWGEKSWSDILSGQNEEYEVHYTWWELLQL